MNKYKFVSLVLAIALLASLARVFVPAAQSSEATDEVVFRNILTRASVRSYVSQPVCRALLDSLCRAGMAAPSAMDMRPWKFVVVDDKDLLQQLADSLPRARMLATAAAAIAVCGDMTVADFHGKSSDWWYEDCSAASQNILLAAHAKGLGAVWTGGYPKADRVGLLQQVLRLPDTLVPLNLIVLGYPDGTVEAKDKYDSTDIIYNAEADALFDEPNEGF